MPGGKVFINERVEESLKRMTKLKTGLDIELYFKDFMFTTENVQYHSMHLFWRGFGINVILYDCAMHCYFKNKE